MRISSIITFLSNPYYLLYRLIRKIPFRWGDKPCVSLYYRAIMGCFPNLDSPQKFTEKLQWLKLHDHNPLYTQLVDKLRAKEYVARLIGAQYCIKTLGAWHQASEIDFDALPNRFVLKCNHFGGGTVIVCKDKSTLDIQSVRRKIQEQLSTSMYLNTREWPYKGVVRRVFAEEYMEDEFGELRDYKFYCFNGEPKMLTIVTDRFDGHYFTNYDMSFNKLKEVHRGGKEYPVDIERPVNFDEMIDIASRLSKGLRFVRIDLYNIRGRIYFGEFTFFPSSGHDDQSSEEWDYGFGRLLRLPIDSTEET